MHRDIESRRVPGVLPHPRQLAALGAVLCLYRVRHGAALAGWAKAAHAEMGAGIDSDGLRESLSFYDCDGRSCWLLYLLPDSDFRAWDRLSRELPSRVDRDSSIGTCQRIWRRVTEQVHGDCWRACALRLHVLPVATTFEAVAQSVLAASLAPLSRCGEAAARRIARAECADGSFLVGENGGECTALPAFDSPTHSIHSFERNSQGQT